jgi:hypothetical protein
LVVAREESLANRNSLTVRECVDAAIVRERAQKKRGTGAALNARELRV